MDGELILKNNLKNARAERKLSQMELAELVGVSRNTISSIETGQFNPYCETGITSVYCFRKKSLKNCFIFKLMFMKK